MVVFDDLGEILPNGVAIEPHRRLSSSGQMRAASARSHA
jgi:hypothetical protein